MVSGRRASMLGRTGDTDRARAQARAAKHAKGKKVEKDASKLRCASLQKTTANADSLVSSPLEPVARMIGHRFTS